MLNNFYFGMIGFDDGLNEGFMTMTIKIFCAIDQNNCTYDLFKMMFIR